ncbi:MAG: translocation/assembly module TamB domain-containing protein [Armatimonadota bacterium]|nr:translocation/assembly module TamB domain-containing protein [Armatimonadota bacterium]
MNRRRRFLFLLITLALLAAFLIAAGLYMRVQVEKVVAGLDNVLIAELKRRLRRDVRVGRVTSRPLGRLVLHDLAIAEGKTFSAGTLMTARRVEVRYAWLDLVLRRVPPVQSVSSVIVTQPSVRLIRKRTGAWNIAPLFKPPPGPPLPRFIGRVSIVKGRALVTDFLGGPPASRPAMIQVNDVDGVLDASAQPMVRFAAAMSGGHTSRVEVAGRYNGRRKSLDMDIVAKGADAAYWSVYRPALEPFRVSAGKFDAHMTVSKTIDKKRRSRWSYVGSGQLKGVTASAPRVRAPFRSVSGRIDFSNELATVDLKAAFTGSPLKAKGTIVLAPKRNVRVTMTSSAADFPALLRALPTARLPQGVQIAGVGTVRALLVGWPPGLTVTGAATVPRATLSGYAVSNLKVTARYAGGVISISRATASTLGGQLSGAGSIDVRNRQYRIELSGAAKSVRLQSSPMLRQAGLSGIADARFTITGPPGSPVVSAFVKVSRGNLRAIPFSRASATFRMAGGRVEIRDMVASSSGGAFRVNGVVTKSLVDLRVAALAIDAGRLLGAFGFKGYGGVAYFNGRIGGPPSNPTVVGDIEIFKGRIGSVQFDHARGHIAGNKAAIALSETTVRRFPMEVTVGGLVGAIATGRPTLDLQLNVKQADVADLAKSLGIAVTATGTMSGSFAVSGTATQPRISGGFTLADGSVSGYPIASASGDIAYAAGDLRVTNVVARSDGALIRAEGSLTASGTISGTFSAEGIPLSGLNERLKPYIALAGAATVSGTIGGTTGSPAITAKVNATDVDVNGQKFGAMSATVGYDGKTARLSDASLTADSEICRVSSFTYNTAEDYLEVSASVENGRIERLFRIVRDSAYLTTPRGERTRLMLLRVPQPMKGTINAGVTASGKIDELQGQLRASAANASVGNQRVDSLEINISADKGRITLDRFAAVSGDLNLTASGDILREKRINLEIEAYNVDVDLLRPWTGVSGISGIATIIAVARGPIDQPTIQASVEMVEPVIRGLKFDRIRASQILVTRNQLELSDVIFTRDSYRGLLYGTLPWDWESLTVPRDQPLKLRAELDKQSLAILSALSSAVRVEGTSGTIDADLDIAGTIDLPDLTGSLAITDGALNLRHFSTAPPEGPSDFKNIQARFTFVQGDISIEKLTASGAKGGSFTASGKIGLADFPNGPVDLKINADRLFIAEQNLSGVYNESITGKLTLKLAAAGPVREPLLSGTALITNARIRIPSAKTKGKPLSLVLPISPKFNITATAGRDVWIYNPRLSAMVRGTGSLSGSITSPLATATLTVQRGNIRLPTARPELRRGGTISVLYAPPAPTRVVLDLEATVSTTARSTLGFPRRYSIVMEIRGPLDNLAIDARSEPPGLTRDQIFALVGHVPGVFAPGEIVLRQEIADIFTAAIVPEVFSPLETAFEEALGLEQFRLELGFQAPIAVFLSKHLFGNLYLSYWRTVSGQQEFYRASLSYRFTDRLQFSAITTDQPEVILEVEGTQRF